MHGIEDPSIVIIVKHCEGEAEFSPYFTESIVFYNTYFLVAASQRAIQYADVRFVFVGNVGKLVEFIESCAEAFFECFAVLSAHEYVIARFQTVVFHIDINIKKKHQYDQHDKKKKYIRRINSK